MMQIIPSRSVPAPNATTNNYSITEDQLLVGSANGFLNDDSDPDGDRLSIILIDGLPFSFGTPITLASGANLTINADGSFQYDQNGRFTYLSAGQTVNDIFTYTISDGRFGFDTSAVCVTISGVTQGPGHRRAGSFTLRRTPRFRAARPTWPARRSTTRWR